MNKQKLDENSLSALLNPSKSFSLKALYVGIAALFGVFILVNILFICALATPEFQKKLNAGWGWLSAHMLSSEDKTTKVRGFINQSYPRLQIFTEIANNYGEINSLR